MGIYNNIDTKSSLLLIIDLQDKLAPAITDFSSILACSLQLAQASVIHQIPALITQQYKKGLGGTNKIIKEALPTALLFDKTYFSACCEPGFLEQLKRYARPQIVVVGTEAHVCVLQTCLDLLQHGYTVVIASDAIGSRNEAHRQIAIEQLREAGAVISCAETVIFQWTKNASTPTFKKILPIIR
jgi:nicotinamidase-related amidase